MAGEETIEHDLKVTTAPLSILTGIIRAGGKALASALVSPEHTSWPHKGFEVTTDRTGRFEAERRRNP